MEPTTPPTTPTKEIDLIHELEDDIVALVDERDELQEKIKVLEAQIEHHQERETMHTLTMVAMTVLYICILLAVTDIANNPEL